MLCLINLKVVILGYTVPDKPEGGYPRIYVSDEPKGGYSRIYCLRDEPEGGYPRIYCV